MLSARLPGPEYLLTHNCDAALDPAVLVGDDEAELEELAAAAHPPQATGMASAKQAAITKPKVPSWPRCTATMKRSLLAAPAPAALPDGFAHVVRDVACA